MLSFSANAFIFGLAAAVNGHQYMDYICSNTLCTLLFHPSFQLESISQLKGLSESWYL